MSNDDLIPKFPRRWLNFVRRRCSFKFSHDDVLESCRCTCWLGDGYMRSPQRCDPVACTWSTPARVRGTTMRVKTKKTKWLRCREYTLAFPYLVLSKLSWPELASLEGSRSLSLSDYLPVCVSSSLDLLATWAWNKESLILGYVLCSA